MAFYAITENNKHTCPMRGLSGCPLKITVVWIGTHVRGMYLYAPNCFLQCNCAVHYWQYCVFKGELQTKRPC